MSNKELTLVIPSKIEAMLTGFYGSWSIEYRNKTFTCEVFHQSQGGASYAIDDAEYEYEDLPKWAKRYAHEAVKYIQDCYTVHAQARGA